MSSIKDENKTLAAADYVVFAMVLAVSAAIGIYHTCTGGKNRTTCKTCFICKMFVNLFRNTIPMARCI